MRSQVLYLAAIAIAAVSSCNTKEKSASAKKDFLTDNLDTTISPAQDFFQYVNGGWIKRNPIPPEESSWGVGNLVQEDIYSRLRKINEDAAAKNAANGTVEQKIGDFWFSSMDSTAIDQQGLQPLQAALKKINDIKSKMILFQLQQSFIRKELMYFLMIM